MEQLTEKAVVGARGVILFLTLEDTKALLQAVQKAVSLHRLHKHQIVFLGTTTWGDHKDQVKCLFPFSLIAMGD